MYFRALAVWCLFLVLAIANGGVREKLLTPTWGPAAGHVASTLLLAALILLVTRHTLPWIAPPDPAAAIRIGLGWAGLTLAFELLGGHFLFHRPWTLLLADYDVTQGRIWVLVPVVITLAPWLWHRRP